MDEALDNIAAEHRPIAVAITLEGSQTRLVCHFDSSAAEREN